MNKGLRTAIAPGIIGLISVGCALLGQQTNTSQQKPSLDDTTKWIEQTFPNNSHIVHQAFEKIDFDAYNNARCHLDFIVDNQVSDFSAIDAVDLADIDPTSIKAGELIHDTDATTVTDSALIDYSTGVVKDHPYVFVSIKTANDVDSVRTYTFNNGHRAGHPQKGHEVGFYNEGIAVEPGYAPRFVNALRHAVELCGGKASTF